jgi:regulator of RNase E activity RraA
LTGVLRAATRAALQRVSTAIESIESGHVLVIDARGETGAASLGHILATRVHARGAAGLVTDGALRDSHLFGGLDLPVYCAARHATTSSIKHHPADLNVPFACAGVLVMPGDVLVGDAEGVVVIPQAMVDEVASDALDQEHYEEYVLSEVKKGACIRDLYPAHRRVPSALRGLAPA